jgi:hypothetical protein
MYTFIISSHNSANLTLAGPSGAPFSSYHIPFRFKRPISLTHSRKIGFYRPEMDEGGEFECRCLGVNCWETHALRYSKWLFFPIMLALIVRLIFASEPLIFASGDFSEHFWRASRSKVSSQHFTGAHVGPYTPTFCGMLRH